MFQDVQSGGVFSLLNLNMRQFYVKLHYGALGTVLEHFHFFYWPLRSFSQETGDSYNKTVPQCNWTQYLPIPNGPLARLRHFTTATTILQGFAFLCELGLLSFNAPWDNQIRKT